MKFYIANFNETSNGYVPSPLMEFDWTIRFYCLMKELCDYRPILCNEYGREINWGTDFSNTPIFEVELINTTTREIENKICIAEEGLSSRDSILMYCLTPGNVEIPKGFRLLSVKLLDPFDFE